MRRVRRADAFAIFPQERASLLGNLVGAFALAAVFAETSDGPDIACACEGELDVAQSSGRDAQIALKHVA